MPNIVTDRVFYFWWTSYLLDDDGNRHHQRWALRHPTLAYDRCLRELVSSADGENRP